MRYLPHMRLIFAFAFLAAPASAWDFTPGLPCFLTDEQNNLAVALTHDPTQPLFSITLSRSQPWPDADVFAIRFDGPSGLTITTDRHVLSDQGRSLTVTDTGFGNVLRGFAGSRQATAVIGREEVSFSLVGAARPTADFEACAVDPAV